ncbi:ComEC/Rec2 family competence protein [Antrihabitans stalactiti]|uniref:ComEC/Rec2 family competence protein n=1 Tax=Antrihabitans stalactiti TaxID=2584121 RepID=A0A848KAB0_9NOCA|nr:ComEC/Rec2 family competence protein [Antrihabitans stalactiti]NMN94596.1 ComEC/Rec2 family competence protein [Antrihabitans stalactiti]
MTEREASKPLDMRLVPSAGFCWAATLFGIQAGWIAAVWLAAAFGCGCLVVIAVLRRGALARIGAGLAAALALGAGFAAAIAVRAHASQTHPLHGLADGAQVNATVVLTTDPAALSASGPQQVIVAARLEQFSTARGTWTVGGAVTVLATARGWESLLPGQRVEFRGSVRAPRHNDLSVATIRAPDPPLTVAPPSFVQRIAGSARAKFAEVSTTALPGAAGGLLPGLVVGDTSNLPDAVRADFKAAGLSHLTAVSGANVAILLGAMLLVVRGLTLGPKAGVALSAVVLALFVVLARPSPSVLRAAVMGSVGLLALVTGRRKQALPALSTAVVLLLAFYPALAVDFGFALSVVATAGLILIAPSWADKLRDRGWPRAPAEAVAVATAAYVVTAPIVAGMSGTVSVVAIGANLLVAVVVAPLTVVGAVAAVAAMVWTPLAVFVAQTAGPLLWWLLWVADRAAAMPGAVVSVPDGLVGAGLCTAPVVVLALWRIAASKPP